MMTYAWAENVIQEEIAPIAETTINPEDQGILTSFLQALPAWVLPVAGAMLILIVVLICLLIHRNKKSPKTPEVEKTTGSADARTNISIFSSSELPVTSIGNIHGIGSRPDQQDAFGVSDLKKQNHIRENGILAIVADGMGGLSHSGEISHTLVQRMLKEYENATGNQRERLLSLGAIANSLASREFGRDTGTTLIAASIQGDKLDFLSIGDSRIALCRSGALLTLNRMHNYAADLDSSAARGLVSISSAMNDPKRARLTSYVGMNDPKAVDLPASPMTLQKGDRILLMTDGVYNTLSDEDILHAMSKPAHIASQQLEEMILSKNKPNQDNYTAIILEI
ncbi:MAG: serine/threonine-protein phosphatase [Clostridia bacterium]|nr:serine/threonine-protein phosphatase [Clostridia bacterium]